MLDAASALALSAGSSQADVSYLPLPNQVDTVISPILAPAALTKTAFTVALLPDGSLVMATNRRRGAECPGGHIEAGEDAAGAARRELLEETGCHALIRPLGFQRMVSQGTAPPGWKYPHPVGFQQFFAGVITGMDPYVDNDECLQPLVLCPLDALDPDGPLKPGGRLLYGAALQLLLPGLRAGNGAACPDHDQPGRGAIRAP